MKSLSYLEPLQQTFSPKGIISKMAVKQRVLILVMLICSGILFISWISKRIKIKKTLVKPTEIKFYDTDCYCRQVKLLEETPLQNR